METEVLIEVDMGNGIGIHLVLTIIFLIVPKLEARRPRASLVVSRKIILTCFVPEQFSTDSFCTSRHCYLKLSVETNKKKSHAGKKTSGK